MKNKSWRMRDYDALREEKRQQRKEKVKGQQEPSQNRNTAVTDRHKPPCWDHWDARGRFPVLCCYCVEKNHFSPYIKLWPCNFKRLFFLLESGLYLSGTVPAYHMYGAWFYPQPEPCNENKSNKMEEFCLFCSWTVSSEAKWLSLHHFPGWRC